LTGSLGADKFGSVAESLPGMDGLLGQAAKMLGGVFKP
jgi:hypothetical protein